MNNDDDYEVGYKKPPKNGRIKKGERRNPKGRPKNSRNYKTIVQEILNSEITVRDTTGSRKMSVRQAYLMKLIDKALKGEMRPAEILMKLEGTIEEAVREAEEKTREQDNAHEIDIPDKFLDDYFEKRLKAMKKKEKKHE